MSSNLTMVIYPTDVDDANEIIADAVIKFNGVFTVRTILGMIQGEAIFCTEDDTEAALVYLEGLEAVSYVSRT